MAESPVGLNEAQSKPKLFTKGGPGGPGRAPLPACFTSLEPLALAQLAATATGLVIEELVPEHLDAKQREDAIAALKTAATDTDPKLRLDAACRMSDRVRGKPREQVEHTGEVGHVTRVVLEIERKPEVKTVEGTVARPKALHGADAE